MVSPALNKTIMVLVGIIISVIVIFNLVGGTSNELQDSSRTVSEANNCSEGPAGDRYDYATGNCTTTAGGMYVPGTYTLPLQSLFSPSGVLLLGLMIGIFVGTIVIIFRFKK